eukprot:Nitzschia sp. Nitz4//scaffold3_size479765//145490//146458//NITZ4_000063-RA/size479765-processed-gene-0.301-mRNA-1//-1//CDS//3329550647//9445//frame0
MSNSRKIPPIILASTILLSLLAYVDYTLVGQWSLSLSRTNASLAVADTGQNLVNPDRLFYRRNSKRFVEDITECIIDRKSCHVLYWHVQKTGGSYIASKFYPLFNGEAYKSKEWCCNSDFMEKTFEQKTNKYCSKRLGVYEVKPEQFQQVIDTCTSITSNSSSTRPRRYIGLMSVREPIQRTLSAIHQRCNVHVSALKNETYETCSRCSYTGDDMAFYDTFVNTTNEVYKSMKENLLQNSSIDIPLYVIDNDDIDDFFHKIEVAITESSSFPLNNTFHFHRGTANSENKEKHCDFGMPSKVMKQQRPALQAYHWLWMDSSLG